MYYINRRFGHLAIFSKFLALPNLVIPGEIQHGYWYGKKWKNYIQSHKLRRFFLWGGSFFEELTSKERQNTLCIGDPFLYLLDGQFEPKVLHQKVNFLLVPRSNSKTLSRKQLLNYHIKFIAKYCKNVNSKGSVSLHPNEANDSEILSLYKRSGLSPTRSSNPPHQEFYRSKLAEYRNHDVLYTDYLGPHVFRARLLGLSILMNLESEPSHTRLGEISSLFDSLYLSPEIEKKQFEISKFELGYPNVVTMAKLSEMFHTSLSQQISLRTLFALKCHLLGLRNQLMPSQSIVLAQENFENSTYECPHCYMINALPETVSSLKCIDCLRRFTPRGF